MESSYSIVKERLLHIIRTQRFEQNKLYSEEELVRILDASRGTVREVLRSLEHDGIITKKHGIGTFVHPKALALPMRFDEITDFSRMIQDNGCLAGMLQDGEPEECGYPAEADATAMAQFLDRDAAYYSFRRIYTADGAPVAHCRLLFPKKNFRHFPTGKVEFLNVFDFIQEYFGQRPNHALISLSAVNAPDAVAKKLELSPGTALLVWDELLLDYQDQIIGYSRIHFSPRMPSLSMLRKSI